MSKVGYTGEVQKTPPPPLPNDVDALKRLVLEQRAALASNTIEIEHLKLVIAKLRRLQFGRSSEKLTREIDQLELRLEELQTAQAQAPTVAPPLAPPEREKPARKPLPEHLPREQVVHQPACACPDCGGTAAADRRGCRAKCSNTCRSTSRWCAMCGRSSAVPTASASCKRARRRGRSRAGWPGPGLLAHVLVAKYADHLPLYRQAQIYARQGIELERSTLADWVGDCSRLLAPLVDALGRLCADRGQAARGRHPGAGVGARTRQNPDRTAVDVRAR